MRSLRLIESLAAVDAWEEHEPALAISAACESEPESSRPRPVPDTAAENYARAATAAGLAGAIALCVSGGAGLASEAVIVAAPRALNYARESFATTFSAGLNRNHHTLVLRPDALRRLDGVDVLIIDPAVLVGESLRVAEINGVDGELHTKVWQSAQTDVDAGLLGPGVHSGCSLSPAHQLPALRDLEVVVSRSADPFAEPLLAAARSADLKLVSVDQADAGQSATMSIAESTTPCGNCRRRARSLPSSGETSGMPSQPRTLGWRSGLLASRPRGRRTC
jgi:H+-transporting ATPase